MFSPNLTIRGVNHRTDILRRHIFEVPEKLTENDQDVHIEEGVSVICNVTL